MNADILITDTLLLPAAGADMITDGALAVKDGLVLWAGPRDQCPVSTAAATIDGRGHLTMPGLVNAHTHAPMVLFRGLADDLELTAWLREHIFPAEARFVDPDMAFACGLLAAAEMLLSGTTCAMDGYFHEGEVARAFAALGLRGVLAQGIIDFPAPGVADPARNIEAAASFLEQWRDRDPLIRPALFAHSPYTCGNETLLRAKGLAREAGVPLFIHVAETENEMDMISEPRGDSPVRHLAGLGILDPDTVCVHCVWTDEEDHRILAATGAPVVICPQSHAKLASGPAPLARMKAAGVRVGLGTDGAASNNTLDMFREMGFCGRLQKVAHGLDPVAVDAASVLEAATRAGAGLSGFPDLNGTLTAGSRADLIMISLDHPRLQPLYNPDLLVYAGSGADVRTVIVDGRPVVREGRLVNMDLAPIMERVRALAGRVRN